MYSLSLLPSLGVRFFSAPSLGETIELLIVALGLKGLTLGSLLGPSSIAGFEGGAIWGTGDGAFTGLALGDGYLGD